MLEELIAEKVVELQKQEIAADTSLILKRNLIDSYAGICGSLLDYPMIEKFKRYAAANPDVNGVGVWGTGRKAQLVHAVFMNAIMGRRSDMVNTYLSPNHMGGNHPSDNVSLLLTLAEWKNLNGGEFLRAMYLVYILSCAFSDYYDPEGGGFDHDAAAGFYTALLAGHLLGLDTKGLVEAQRIAGAMGLNTNQAGVGQVTDWKHCTYSSCAMRGVSAAMMAKAGFQGPVEIYEGEAGVNRFLPHSESFMPQLPDMSIFVFKQWQALVFCQTSIDVALELAPQFKNLDVSRVEKLEMWNYKMAMVQAGTEDSYKPDSRAGRTHSLPYCVAAALLNGAINYESFSDRSAKDPKLQDLIKKTILYEDEQMTAAYPAKAPCRITITLKDGRQLSAGLDCPHGDPKDPLSDEEVAQKARGYLANLIPDDQARASVDKIWEMETQPDLNWLLNPLWRELNHG